MILRRRIPRELIIGLRLLLLTGGVTSAATRHLVRTVLDDPLYRLEITLSADSQGALSW